MKIQVNNYYIEDCRDGFEIYQLALKKDKQGLSNGEMYKKDVRWYPILESACKRVLTLDISNSEATSIKELSAHITQTKEELIKALDNI